MASNISTSLIISTYNRSDALELCVKSVLRQSLLPDEIIIADDGSKEDTGELIHQLATSSDPGFADSADGRRPASAWTEARYRCRFVMQYLSVGLLQPRVQECAPASVYCPAHPSVRSARHGPPRGQSPYSMHTDRKCRRRTHSADSEIHPSAD